MTDPAIEQDQIARLFGIGRLFRLTYEAVVGADLSTGSIVLWNPAAERVFGYTPEEALGMPLHTLVAPELVDAHLGGIRRFRMRGAGPLVGKAPVEVPAITKDGRRITVALSLTEIPTAEAHRHVVAIIRDVSSRKRMQEDLLRANQTMKDFVATASHELRTPLTAIVGFGELLRGRAAELADTDAMEFADVIVRSGGQAARLVDNLLTVSKIQAESIETYRQEIDVAALLNQAIEDSPSEPVLDVDPDLTVMCDHDHLSRIVANLLTNAAKYGEPPITISASRVGDMVEIRFRDHGVGVPTDFRARLFEKFARADPAAGVEGTGLGLSIIRGLARANAGDAFYEPLADGSAFGVRLPSG